MRILIVAGGHPGLGNRDEALAAHALFSALDARPDCDAWFLGCGQGAASGVGLRGCISQPFDAPDHIYATRGIDPFRQANRDPLFPAAFASLLARLAPDIVHFFGFAGVGIEAAIIARRALPDARLVMTLPDYAAICANGGRMVTTQGALCDGASLQACSRCFAERGPTEVYLRDRYIRHCLERIDHFIAPGEFLRGRFVAWGLPPAMIARIPWVLPREAGAPPARQADGLLRIGYCGAPGPADGFDVLLQAARLLDEAGDRVVRILLHGEAGVAPPGAMSARVSTSTQARLRDMDAVVVPSVWWEASPLTVALARQAGVPALCSDIGAMAEAVRDGVDGFHFAAGSPEALADLLLRLAALPFLLTALPQPAAPADALAQHLSLYRSIQAAPLHEIVSIQGRGA